MAKHTLLTLEQATEALKQGQIIAYPTEAVYGLGCDPDNESAVRGLLSLKGRPASKGLILIASSFEQLSGYVAKVEPELLNKAQATWPGPVTWLFPKHPDVPQWLAGDHETIAVRISAHPVCQSLCQAFDGPLVSTSANPSGAHPAVSAGEVEMYFGSFLGGIIDGPLGDQNQVTEIRDLLSDRIIRKG